MNLATGCRHVRRLVAVGDAWNVDAGVRTAVRSHLATCPACRDWFQNRVEEEPGCWAWLDGPAVGLPRLVELRHRYATRARWARASAAAVLIAGLLAGLWWWQAPPQAPAPSGPVVRFRTEADLPFVERPPEHASWFTFEVEGTPVLLIYTEEDGS